jgi:dipeptidyl aminopeptidase/acylaminoacyl peptidase
LTGQLNRVDVTVLPVGWTAAGGPASAIGDGPHAGPLPAELPTEVSGSWSPTLSPDGRHAAYVSDRSGTPNVWVQPVGSRLTFLVDTGEHPVIGVHWSTGGGWLACQIAPGGAPRTEVWLVRPDGSELHQVAGFGADSADNLRWLPGRSLLALTENLTRTVLVDAVSGARHVLAEGDLISLFDVSGDGERTLLRHGARGDRHVVVRELATGVEQYVASGEQACFGPDGRTVYVRADAGEFPVLIKALNGQVQVLAERHNAELESFALTADARTVALGWNVFGGASELDTLDLVTGVALPVAPLPGGVIHGLAWSADGSTLTFAAEGPGQPHGVWTVDADGLHPVSVEPAAPGAVAPVLHAVASTDDITVTGWLYPPVGDGPHPTVLWLHGGPEAQDRPGHSPLFQSLVDRGIAVFAANVRGSSGFGRTFVNADNGALRYGAIADVASCVTYLVDAGIATPGRVGVMGRSYGGYLTLASLVTYPELFAVGIDICGMSNFATFYEHTEPWIAAAAVGKYGDPLLDAELLHDLSPMTRIDNLRTPLMVVHGENDSNVPVIEAEQVVAALAERGVEHRYLLFADEGHELLHRSSRATYLRETVDWLTRHLLPGATGLLAQTER